MGADVKVFGPDGRQWTISRRPDPPGFLRSVLPGPWLVEAGAPDETRRWRAPSRHAARDLVVEVALALRTGVEGPAGELSPDEPSNGTAHDDPSPDDDRPDGAGDAR